VRVTEGCAPNHQRMHVPLVCESTLCRRQRLGCSALLPPKFMTISKHWVWPHPDLIPLASRAEIETHQRQRTRCPCCDCGTFLPPCPEERDGAHTSPTGWQGFQKTGRRAVLPPRIRQTTLRLQRQCRRRAHGAHPSSRSRSLPRPSSGWSRFWARCAGWAQREKMRRRKGSPQRQMQGRPSFFPCMGRFAFRLVKSG